MAAHFSDTPKDGVGAGGGGGWGRGFTGEPGGEKDMDHWLELQTVGGLGCLIVSTSNLRALACSAHFLQHGQELVLLRPN